MTEHHPPEGSGVPPNIDIVHGAGHLAVINKSGVYPHLPPFSIGEPEVVLEMEPPKEHGARGGGNKLFSGHADSATLASVLGSLERLGKINQRREGGGRGQGKATTVWRLNKDLVPDNLLEMDAHDG